MGPKKKTRPKQPMLYEPAEKLLKLSNVMKNHKLSISSNIVRYIVPSTYML